MLWVGFSTPVKSGCPLQKRLLTGGLQSGVEQVQVSHGTLEVNTTERSPER